MPSGYNIVDNKEFQNRVKKLLEKGFTPTQIAQRMGYHRSTISEVIKILGLQKNYKNKIEEAYKKLKTKLNRPPSRPELAAAADVHGATVDTYTKGKFVLSKGTQLSTEARLEGRKKFTETFKAKQPDKIRPTRFEEGIKGPEKEIQNYLKDLKKRFKYPKTARAYLTGIKDGTILSNDALAKKYKITTADVAKINVVLTKKHNLKFPKQTYGEKADVMKELSEKRREDIKKTSAPIKERLIKEEVRRLGQSKNIDLAHRASLRANAALGADYLTTSLGIDRDIVNQQLVKPFETELRKLYKSQKELIKGLTPGKFPNEIQKQISQLNSQIMDMSTKTDGALQGVLMNEKTGRVGHIFGKDYSKVLGAGLVEGPVKGLTPEKIATIKAQLPEQIKLARREPKQLIESLINLFNSKETTLPQKNRIGVALGCVGAAEGGRIGYALGSATMNCINTKLTNEPVQSSMKLRVAEGVGKIKPAATRFLSLLGRGGVKAAPLAALAAAGAAIEPLVRQFRNDDPSTYLTNENQMKGMLLATIEGETPKVDEEILKWQTPALAGATAAGAIPGAREVYLDRLTGRGPAGPAGTRLPATIVNKPVGKARAVLGLRGVAGKALGASFSPLAVAATLPLGIAAQRKGGTEWGDIATDPMNWMGPAFASTGAQMATRGMKPTGIIAQAIRLGIGPRALMAGSRFLGWPGLAITAGMWGYDKWKGRSIMDEDDDRKGVYRTVDE